LGSICCPCWVHCSSAASVMPFSMSPEAAWRSGSGLHCGAAALAVEYCEQGIVQRCGAVEHIRVDPERALERIRLADTEIQARIAAAEPGSTERRFAVHVDAFRSTEPRTLGSLSGLDSGTGDARNGAAKRQRSSVPQARRSPGAERTRRCLAMHVRAPPTADATANVLR
jgi:hypothetical protein